MGRFLASTFGNYKYDEVYKNQAVSWVKSQISISKT